MALLPKVPQNPFPARNRTRSPLGLPGDAVVPPVPSADALQQLQDRLARGEITRVQFEAGVRALARTTATQGISPGTAAPFTAAKPPAVAHGVSAGAVPGVPVQPVSTRGEVEEPAEDEFVYEPYTPPTKAPEEMTRSEVQQEAAELTERIRRAKSSPAFARSPELVADLRRMEERLSLLSNYLAGLIPEVPEEPAEEELLPPLPQTPEEATRELIQARERMDELVAEMTRLAAKFAGFEGVERFPEYQKLQAEFDALKRRATQLETFLGTFPELAEKEQQEVLDLIEQWEKRGLDVTTLTELSELLVKKAELKELIAQATKQGVSTAGLERQLRQLELREAELRGLVDKEKKGALLDGQAEGPLTQEQLDEFSGRLRAFASTMETATTLEELGSLDDIRAVLGDIYNFSTGELNINRVPQALRAGVRALITEYLSISGRFDQREAELLKTVGQEKFAPVTDVELSGYEAQLDAYLAELAKVTVFDMPPSLPGMPQFPGATVGPPPDISVLLGIVFDPQTGSFGKRVSPEMRAKVAALFARYEAALREYNRIEAAKARAREIADEIARENAKENAAKARFEAEHSTEAIDSWEEAAYRRQMAQDAQDALQFLMTIMQNPEWYAQLEASGLLAKYAALAGIDLPARVKAEREHVELRLRQIAEQARGQPLQKYTELLRKLSMETSWTLDELLALVPRPGVAAQTPQFRVVE